MPRFCTRRTLAPLVAALALTTTAVTAQETEEATPAGGETAAAASAATTPETAAPGTAAAETAPSTPAQPKSARLQGSAYLDRRRGVVGASVLVRSESDAGRLYLTATDLKGRFRFEELPEGDYTVEVRRDGLVPVTKRNVAVQFPFRAVVEVTMQPGEAAEPASLTVPGTGSGPLSVRGRVVDADGKPVNEVALRLVHAEGRSDPRVERSDEQGRVVFEGLAPGPWVLATEGLGFLPLRARLDLGGDVELRLVVVEQPGGYDPSPLDLLPPERPIPPASLADTLGGRF